MRIVLKNADMEMRATGAGREITCAKASLKTIGHRGTEKITICSEAITLLTSLCLCASVAKGYLLILIVGILGRSGRQFGECFSERLLQAMHAPAVVLDK